MGNCARVKLGPVMAVVLAWVLGAHVGALRVKMAKRAEYFRSGMIREKCEHWESP